MKDYRNKKPIELSIEVPNSYEEIVDIIKKELDCPLPVREGEKFHDLKYKLIGLWKKIVRDHSIDNEYHHVYEEDEDRDFELEQDCFEELHPIAVNLLSWINEAKKEFLELTRPIQSLVADKSIYDKHILRKKLSIEEMSKIAISTNCSFLFAEITPPLISKIIVLAAKEFFEAIIKLDKLRFSVVCNRDIGVTKKGLVTKCLMIEIDCNQSLAHAYPCSLYEAQNNVITYSIKNNERFGYHEYEDHEENNETKFRLNIKINIDE